MTPQRSALVVLVGVAGLAAGCGGGDKKEAPATPEAAVRQTFDDYYAALRSGDFEKACSLDSKATVKAIEASGKSCAEATKAALGLVGVEIFKNMDAGEPRVTGDRAVLHYTITSDKFPNGKLETDQRFVKEDGAWRLESPNG